MHRLTRFSSALGLSLLSLAAVSACSDDDNTNPAVDAGNDADAQPTEDAVKLTRECTDALESVAGDPGPLEALAKGTVIKCAAEEVLTKEQLDTRMRGIEYEGTGPTSGVRILRVSYRTTRGDASSTAAVSSAILYLPTAPRTLPLPLIVDSHGSVGQAAKCAPSITSVHQLQALALVGGGYAVIAPDLAGYANYGAAGNPPNAYASATDVSHSTYDSARALKTLLGDNASDKVVLVGLSQGGHSTLASLADRGGYGADLNVVATVAYAPLWLSQKTWGALFAIGGNFPIATNAAANGVSVWYHYTHAELLDGKGAGIALFKPEKRAAIQQFIDDTCWGPSYPVLEGAGTVITDLFDADFVNSIQNAATNDAPCQDATCSKWIGRYLEDRPHLTGKAATTPLLVPYGDSDMTLTSDRAACAFDRLRADSKNLSVCVKRGAGHTGIVGVTSDYVNEWISHYTYGTAAVPACDLDETAIVDKNGAKVICSVPPSNE